MPSRSPARLDTDRLLALFFMAWRGFAAEPDAILADSGLGRVHHRVLYTVARLPDVTVGDLAATLGITRQALHRPLADLVSRRLVSRRVSPDSKRERALRLTEKGRRLEDRASQAQRAHLERVFAEVGRTAADGWVRVMEGLAAPALAGSPGLMERIVG